VRSLQSLRARREADGQARTRCVPILNRLAAVDKLLAKGIEPYATLYHWDLPEWAQKQHAGWFGRGTSLAFADYSTAVVKRLGDRVKKWATLNEPEVIIAGYIGDGMAPAFNRPEAAYRVGHHLLLGHALATSAMRAARNDVQCGIVLNLVPIDPSDPSNADAREHARQRYVKSYTWYLDALLKGHYPEEVLKELARPDLLNPVEPLDMSLIAQRLDFLGINYYTRFLVNEKGEMVFNAEEPKTQMGWEIHPDSLSSMLIDLGAALDDTVCGDGRVHDIGRTRYLHQHIKAVAKAARAGVPMKGYFVWSLMDNLEWPLGFAKTFGIVHVDRKTLARTVKDSGRWYAKVIRKNTR
jgi:beta-glucosidase